MVWYKWYGVYANSTIRQFCAIASIELPSSPSPSIAPSVYIFKYLSTDVSVLAFKIVIPITNPSPLSDLL